MGDTSHRAYENEDSTASFTLIKCSKMIKEGHLQSAITWHQCQGKSIPQSLLSFITSLFYGPKYKGTLPLEVLTISQLIMFNTKEKSKRSAHRHSSTQPPLPFYVGLKVHSDLRSKTLIQRLHNLGMSVSWITKLEEDIACNMYKIF